MNTLVSRFVAAFALVSMILTGLVSAVPVQAATTSSLIKGSSSTVYWYASNGNRYVYPNIKTFWSWHTSSDLSKVQKVSDAQLATMPLGGNVTYRPGYRLVKSTTNERVYAVSRYGTLRWITNEQVASALYGWDWNTKIDDVPDAFFSNYTIGSPIYTTADYNVSTEYNTVYNPNDNISNNVNTNGYNYNGTYYNGSNSITQNNVTVTVDQTSIASGKRVNITATASDSSYATFTIYDERTNAVLQTCYNVGTCTTSQYVYQNNSEASMRVYVVVNRNGNSTSVFSPYISFTNSNINNNTNTTNNITVTVDRTSINSGDNVLVTATANDALNATYTIYDDRAGTALKTCYGASSCSLSQPVYRSNTEASMRFYVVANRSGIFTTVYSPYVSFNTTNNCAYYNNCNTNNGFDGTTAVNASISSRYTDNNGENIVFSANVVNPITSLSNVTIALYDQNNNQLLKTCSANTYCAITLSSLSPVTRTLYARATDQNGRTVESTRLTASYGTVVNNPPVNNGTFTATANVSTNKTTVALQDTVTITANVSNYNVPVSQLEVRIFDERDNRLLGTCNSVATCSVNTYVWRIAGQSDTFRYYAIVDDMQSHQIPWVYSPSVTLTN